MIKVRYYDVINKTKQTETAKSGDEIVADIVSLAGLEII